MDEIASESLGMRDPLLTDGPEPEDAEVEQLYVDHHRRLRGLAAAVTFDQSPHVRSTWTSTDVPITLRSQVDNLSSL